jgi:hypothetical protein
MSEYTREWFLKVGFFRGSIQSRNGARRPMKTTIGTVPRVFTRSFEGLMACIGRNFEPSTDEERESDGKTRKRKEF